MSTLRDRFQRSVDESTSSLQGNAARHTRGESVRKVPCPAVKTERMDWLYRHINAQHMNDSFVLCPQSQQWLQTRVDAADTVAKRDRADSEWWEKKTTEFRHVKMLPKIHEEKSEGVVEDLYVELSMEEVLANAQYRDDFRSFLSESYSQQGLDFLDALKEVESLVHDNPKKATYAVRRLHRHFFDSSAEDKVLMPENVRNEVEQAVGQVSDGKLSEEERTKRLNVCLNVLKVARDAVVASLAEEFPAFLKSDEYAEMLDVHLGGAATSFLGGGWVNQGYRSLQVKVEDIIGLEIGNKKVWPLLSVDSKCFKGEISSGGRRVVFDEEFQFPLLNTTHHARLILQGPNSAFFGQVVVPISTLKQPFVTRRYYLKPRSKADKVSGFANLRVVLSKDAPSEHRKEVPDPEGDNAAIADFVRGLVSKKKKRFREDGFDLDLTYVTDRVVAMGFPSESLEGVYRNNMKDVQRFFNKRHPRSHKLYNLCSERFYDANKFHAVARFPFDDHNPCSLEVMKAFCKDLHDWLNVHPQNVGAIHCKAGKGRTGTVIAGYLLYAGICSTAEEALEYFARQRTMNGKGVTIPSQQRFVYYFSRYCQLRRVGVVTPARSSLFLSRLILHNVSPSIVKAQSWFRITQNNYHNMQFVSKRFTRPRVSSHNARRLTFHLQKKPVLLTDDIKLEVFYSGAFGKEKLCQFWFNTRYLVDQVKQGVVDVAGPLGVVRRDGKDKLRFVLTKPQLDKACKDQKNKTTPADFKVELVFVSGNLKQHLLEAASMVSVLPSSSAAAADAVEESEPEPVLHDHSLAGSIASAVGRVRHASASNLKVQPEPVVEEQEEEEPKKKGKKKGRKKRKSKKEKVVLKLGSLGSIKI